LKEGLVELGYNIEGQNIAIVNRFAFSKAELLSKLATKLVILKVDVIVLATLTAARCGPLQVQGQCLQPGTEILVDNISFLSWSETYLQRNLFRKTSVPESP